MATKDIYVRKLEAQLEVWDAKFDVWKAKAEKTGAAARIGYENELEGLRSKRASARRTLEHLGKRSDDAWEDMKDGAESIWDDLGKAVERVAARFD